MTFEEIFVAARLAVTAAILIYASWSDFKTREVSNRVWVIYAPIALGLSLAEFLLYDPSKLLLFGVSVGLTIGLAFLLFYTGGFGGADSKALMCIAVALPFAPTFFTPIFGISPTSQFIFPLTIFSNGVLFAAATGIYMIGRNVVWHKRVGKKMFAGTLAAESIGKKLLVLITGYRVPIGKLQAKWHVFPMEDYKGSEGDVERKLVVVPHDDGRDEIVERLSNAAKAGKIDNYVWATPGLPLLIFITLGLFVALLFGDVIWLVVRGIMG